MARDASHVTALAAMPGHDAPSSASKEPSVPAQRSIAGGASVHAASAMTATRARSVQATPVRATDAARPTLGAAWSVLQSVTDPEIPPISIVDLGMVRSLEWRDTPERTLVVRLAPTYSGCPAVDVISGDVRTCLREAGVQRVEVVPVLSPPWTTDWITPRGRRMLREQGIAPPAGMRTTAMSGPASGTVVDVRGLAPLRRSAPRVACPRCGSDDTRLVSAFGSTACKAHRVCNACAEPFDHLKPL